MNCPRCDARVAFAKKMCDNCGQDLTNHRKVISMSNKYYNTALEQAKVRDLSGAIRSLRQSLEFNKRNTNARNLLGLIYYEEGEVVSALSEWVVSRNFQMKYNDAEAYIRAVQENPNKLDMYNQTIKKYNSALYSAKHGDEDMAIIQLKKVVGLNPKFIRASQLLALLYMMTERRENKVRAKKLLLNIQKIDVTNTTTIRYLNELQDVHVKGEEVSKKIASEPQRPEPQKVLPKVEQDAYKPITPYKEEKPSVLPFINVVVGVIIGMALMGFLIMPHINASKSQKENEDFKKYSETKVANDSDVSSLKAQIKELNKEKAALEKENKELQGGDENGESMKDSYEDLLAAIQAYENGDKTLAAESLAKINEAVITSETAKAIYEKIKEETYLEMSNSIFEEGRDAYNGEGE
ncbi:MAG: hypothetical protein IJ733_03165, partial [Lachnospiraceae bacterium]|nr:hypothetical protein [Lachnospiraceae bacterium]